MPQELNVQDLRIRSSAFDGQKRIPEEHTGDGEDRAPALEWSGVPDGTKSFAVVVHDPDAPLVDGFTHWVAYNIPGDASGIPEDGEGVTQGTNSFGNQGYNGPAPPEGHGPHHYYFMVFALREEPKLAPDLSLWQLLKEIEPQMLGMNRLVGTYSRA